MRLHSVIVLVGILSLAVSAYADVFVIDDFSCTDSLSQTGVGFTTSGAISCPGAIGGFRADSIFLPSGTGSAVSTIASNPPAGAITGTIGANLSGGDVMIWSGSSTGGVANLPNLDLTGNFILLRSESDLGGTFDVSIASGPSLANHSDFTAAMPANGFSSGFADVLIPLVTPTSISGTGGDLSDVTGIGLVVSVPGGGSWELGGVSTVVPEPSLTWLVGGLTGLLVAYRRVRRTGAVKS